MEPGETLRCAQGDSEGELSTCYFFTKMRANNIATNVATMESATDNPTISMMNCLCLGRAHHQEITALKKFLVVPDISNTTSGIGNTRSEGSFVTGAVSTGGFVVS